MSTPPKYIYTINVDKWVQKSTTQNTWILNRFGNHDWNEPRETIAEKYTKFTQYECAVDWKFIFDWCARLRILQSLHVCIYRSMLIDIELFKWSIAAYVVIFVVRTIHFNLDITKPISFWLYGHHMSNTCFGKCAKIYASECLCISVRTNDTDRTQTLNVLYIAMRARARARRSNSLTPANRAYFHYSTPLARSSYFQYLIWRFCEN